MTPGSFDRGQHCRGLYSQPFFFLALLPIFLNSLGPSPLVIREQKTVKKGMAQRHSRFTHDPIKANEQILKESKKEAVLARWKNTVLSPNGGRRGAAVRISDPKAST